MAIVLTIFISELLHLFTTAEYYSAAIAVGPLCFSVIALATMQVTGLGISLSRKTQYFPISAGIAAAVNVALNVLLIPLWGILGAAVATAASYTVLTICYLIFSQRLYPFKYDVQAIIKITMIGVAFLSIIIFFIINNIALNLIIKFGCVFLFIGALIALRVFDQEETSAIRQHLRIMKTKR
jgi:O-antigen/teichoic acid export membrane protein